MDLFSTPDDKTTLDLPPSKADFYPNFLSKKQDSNASFKKWNPIRIEILSQTSR